jgi:hypothetical protein
VICERCGVDFDTLPMGSWPFCKGKVEDHAPGHYNAVGDDIPGGFVQENFGHEPETFYSKNAMARRAKELGLYPLVKNAGPLDKHCPRWSAVSPASLQQAEALVKRVCG